FDDARLYDIETGRHTEDIPYWERLIDELRPASVLELGCGTGRLLGPIARRGLAHRAEFRLVGLDLSAPLLEAARERIGADSELRGIVRLVEADMSDFALEDRFDLVIIAFNGLGFVVGPGRQRACLHAVRHHLAPGGRLAIDLIVPRVSYLALSERTSPVRLGEDLHDPAPGVTRLLRYDTERYDPVRQVDDSIYQYELQHADGRVERFSRDLSWQMTFPNELELLMEGAGLRVTDRYGDYERSPFDRRSPLYLWIAAAADDPAS
ncbi:MAG: class I SAM-dependent methyltransferase, partial [Chloroflexota bacterium]